MAFPIDTSISEKDIHGEKVFRVVKHLIPGPGTNFEGRFDADRIETSSDLAQLDLINGLDVGRVDIGHLFEIGLYDDIELQGGFIDLALFFETTVASVGPISTTTDSLSTIFMDGIA